MTTVRRRGAALWLARHMALALLFAAVFGPVAGAVADLVGAAGAGDALWMATGVCGAVYALWAVAEALRHGRSGVDIIALLALAGAIALRELLAAAVISVMLTSGRALESWAAGRARRDLNALLERVPRTARRYRGQTLETVPLDTIEPGDALIVSPGDVVPVDGTLGAMTAILDESALTGEPLPVERRAGEPVRSGVVNAGGPFDLLAAARAADSTYAGIVRLVSEAESSQAPFVRLADRYALWFLLVSVAAAGCLGGGRGGAGGGGPGGGDAVPADPGRPGCPGVWALARGAPRRGGEGRRRARAPRPLHDLATGQDRDAHQRAPGPGHHHNGRPGGACGRLVHGGILGPGIAACRRERHRRRRRAASVRAAAAGTGRGGYRAGDPGSRRRPPGVHRQRGLGWRGRHAGLGEDRAPPGPAGRRPYGVRCGRRRARGRACPG